MPADAFRHLRRSQNDRPPTFKQGGFQGGFPITGSAQFAAPHDDQIKESAIVADDFAFHALAFTPATASAVTNRRYIVVGHVLGLYHPIKTLMGRGSELFRFIGQPRQGFGWKNHALAGNDLWRPPRMQTFHMAAVTQRDQ